MPSVIPKNNKKKVAYRVTISLGYDGSGKKQTKSFTYYPTAKTEKQQYIEAYNYGVNLENRLKYGWNLEESNITFEELYEKCKEYEANTLAKKTCNYSACD